MAKIIPPKKISGFTERLPEEQIIENKFLDIIRKNYELAWFTPLVTSAVERTETLTSKWANDKEIYWIHRLSWEQGDDTNLWLHFDLTVPLARYVSQNYDKLSYPFRRYQIQKVWRWERAQKWRSREFYQADIDIVNEWTLPMFADTEVLYVICKIFNELNIWEYTVLLNNKKIILWYLESLKIPEEKKWEILRIIDKKDKVPHEITKKSLEESLWVSIGDKLLKFIISVCIDSNDTIIKKLRKIDNSLLKEGLDELETVYNNTISLWIDASVIKYDPCIVRGLDYYTWTIFETFIWWLEKYGSVCSWGRYEELASNFIDKKLPWVGISIWLTRLVDLLLLNKTIQPEAQTPTKVLVTRLEEDYLETYLDILKQLREANIPSEIFLTDWARLKKQLGYADKKKIPYAIIAWWDEIKQWKVQLKNLKTWEQDEVKINEIAKKIV